MNFTGVCVATVAGLDDPEGEARVRVEFPMLPSGPKSAWAPLARPFAGAGRGIYYMPEVGDEALVAFEHGDFDHPFIVGFLWNGQDGQPDDGIDENVRRIQTKSGHQIDLDDRAGAEAIVIRTAAGHTIEMTDMLGSSHITLTTVARQKVEIADVPPTITLSTIGGQKVEIADLPPGITVTSPFGAVTVACASANITAPEMILAGNVAITGTLLANGPVTSTQGFIRITSTGPQAVT